MKTHDVIGWLIVDQNGEWIMRCATRKEARELCRGDGRVCKIVVEH
jgi:hypothetical protein